MRPVLVNPSPSYSIPLTMTTYKDAIKVGLKNNSINPVSGASTYSTQQVLGILLTLTGQNAGMAKWGKLNAVNKALVTNLINYFSENATMKYGNARGALIDNYGQYCNYCGTPVQDTALAIEHCLPKSEFPSQMLTYTNFFLCCPSCNSFKGSEPNYKMSDAWAKKYYNPPTIQQVLAGGIQRQIWPNSDYAWVGFSVNLWDASAGTLKPIPIQDAININNLYVGTLQNIIIAQIQGYNAGKPVAVVALMNTNDSGNPTLKQQEDNFIDIIKINSFSSGVYSDRRVTNRTAAWLNILASLQNLSVFPSGSGPWQYMVKQIFSTAKSAGFFEIWASLLYMISPPSTGSNSVYLLFRTAACDNKMPLYYFPGTNAAQLPDK